MNKNELKPGGFRVPLNTIEKFYYVIVMVLAVVSVGLQSPGQISMDTSIQLYEAKIGESINYHPPFMSALLSILGGGEVSTFFFICINTILTYGALLLTLNTALKKIKTEGHHGLSLWRAFIVLLLLINPIVFIYVGIVWKDVLFSSLILIGTTCALSVTDDTSEISKFDRIYLLSSTFFFSAAFLVRQQGVFMAPILLLLPLYFLFKKSKNIKVDIAILSLLFGTFLLLLNGWADYTIKNSGSRPTQVGYRNIMTFDISGILKNNNNVDIDMQQRNRDAILKYYQPSRVDYLGDDPAALEWFNSKTIPELFQVWSELIINHPSAYFIHRFNAVSTLYGINGVAPTAPLHIGIDGNEEYLKAINIKSGRDDRDLLVYKIGSMFTSTVLFRHISWLGVTIILLIVLAKKYRRNMPELIVLTACMIFYLVYIPTMISSDFRYLYPAIPLISTILMRKLIA